MRRKIFKELKIWKDKKKRKPLIVKGARQIGKTYSILEFGAKNFSKIHEINFEKSSSLIKIFDGDLKPKDLINAISFEKGEQINLEQDLLFFDEIQECPRALTSLKYFYEDLPQLAICAAGSLLGVKLNEVSYPVGKIDEIEMFPMSFFEFLDAIDESLILELLSSIKPEDSIPVNVHEKTWKLLKNYFITGGLPEVVLEYIEFQSNYYEAFKKIREKQKQLITDYLADMAKHSGKENSMHLQRLWSQIAVQLSQEHNSSAPKFKFKGAIPEKNRYSRLASTIDWLRAAGLIIQVPILEKARLPLKAYCHESSFKLFINDIGLLGALAGLSPKTILDYDYGTYKGFFAENFVAQEFLASGINSQELFAWKENRSELEFIREINGEIYPIEVKSGFVKKSKSLEIFSEKYKPKQKTILSANEFKVSGNLHKYPLYLASRFPIEIL